MTFFKKTQEPDNFAQLVVDFILAKAQNFNSRYASVSDVMALASIEMLIDKEIKNGTYFTRLAASSRKVTSEDFETVRKKYYKKFNDAVAEGGNPKEIMKQLRVEFLEDENEVTRNVRDYVMQQLWGRQDYFKNILKIEDPTQVIANYFGIGDRETNEQGFLDYLIKPVKNPNTGETKKDSKGQDMFELDLKQQKYEGRDRLQGVIGALAAGIIGGVGRSEKTRGIQTQQRLGPSLDAPTSGRKPGEGESGTLGDIIGGEQSTLDSDEAEKALEADISSANTIVTSLSALGYKSEARSLDEALKTKQSLFEQKNNLTPEQLEEYKNVSLMIKKAVDSLSSTMAQSNQTQAVKAAFATFASQVPNLFFIPGTEVTVFEEKPDEPMPETKTRAPRAGEAAAISYSEAAKRHYDQLKPYMIQSGMLHDEYHVYQPYVKGVLSPEQMQAAVSGDTQGMLDSGLSLEAAFRLKLMDIAHELDVNHKLESSGIQLPPESEVEGIKIKDLKKSAYDRYNQQVRALASQPPFSDEQGNIRPEILSILYKFLKPGKDNSDIPFEEAKMPKTGHQYTLIGFDTFRINAELTRLLSNLGLTSFGQLADKLDSPEVEAELDKIVSEESHYGMHVGVPGEQVEHIAYLPYSKPDPQNPNKFAQARPNKFSFNPQQFRAYLKDWLKKLVATNKSPLYSQKREKPINPDNYGARPMWAESTGAGNAGQSTQLGEQQNAQTATYSYGEDYDKLPAIGDVAYYASEHHHAGKKVRRFKVVVR